MKKTKLLAILIAVLTVLSVFPFAVSVSAEDLIVDTAGKTDVLDEAVVYFNSTNNQYTPVTQLTDGVYASNSGGKVYFNKSHCSKDEMETLEQNPGAFEFKMADGTTKHYYYTFEFEDFCADVSSFAMYFNNENTYAEDEKHFPEYHIDCACEIIVSCDGGKTWELAWASVPFMLTADGQAIQTAFGRTIDEGGNMTEVKLKDASGAVNCTYRYVTGDFEREFKNVTNIVYGCVNYRRNSADGAALTTGFYYAVRMTEFDVYGTKKTAETEAVTTAAPETKPAETTAEAATEAAVVTEAPTEAPETQADAPATEAQTAVPAVEKKGCGSSVAFGAVALVSVLGTALIRKKH